MLISKILNIVTNSQHWLLLYPDISNFTFQDVKILKCRIFLINFLDELGNFKQKNYTSKCKFFLHFKATDPLTF